MSGLIFPDQGKYGLTRPFASSHKLRQAQTSTR